MHISISPEVAALLGALIGALPQLITTLVNHRVRAREQLRQLVVQSAIESWKFRASLPNVETIGPLEHSILHAAKMAEIAFSDEKLTPEQLAKRLKEISALMDTLAEHARSVGRKTAGT